MIHGLLVQKKKAVAAICMLCLFMAMAAAAFAQAASKKPVLNENKLTMTVSEKKEVEGEKEAQGSIGCLKRHKRKKVCDCK